MPFSYPSGPLMAEKSISRERALHMAHFPQDYVDAFEAGHIRLPSGQAGQAWRNFFNNPEKYQRNLTAFGLGGVLAFKGEGMTGYYGGTKIPFHRVASNSVKPDTISVKEKVTSLANAAKEAAKNAKLAWKAAIPRHGGAHFGSTHEKLHEKYQELQRKADRFDDNGRVNKWVDFEVFCKKHEKFSDPHFLDYAYFKEAYPVHLAHTLQNDFTYVMSNKTSTSDSLEKLRESAEFMFGAAPESLEGSVVSRDGNAFIISNPVVIRNDAGLPLLAYGMNEKDNGSLSSDIILQDPSGNGFGLATMDNINDGHLDYPTFDRMKNELQVSNMPEIIAVGENDLSKDVEVTPLSLRR